jgi:predicted MFS family arabinose efflux permease
MPIIQNRWLMLAVLFLARATMALQFQTVASTGPFLRDALSIDFAALGTLIGLYMLPGVFIALPGGLLGQRLGSKRMVLAGLALMAVGGVLMTFAESFGTAAMARVVSGTGAVLMSVLIARMVTDWFAGREIVTAMAIVIASWPFGLAVGLVLFGPLAAAAGSSVVMDFSALAAALALLLVAVFYRDPSGMPAASAKLTLNLTRREWLLMIIAGVCWGAFNVAYIVLISFAPELFAARGYSVTDAGRIVSLIGWFLIPSIPLAGALIEKFGRPRRFMFGSFLIVAAALVALPYAPQILIPFAVLVLVIGIPGGPLMALPAQALRPESRASGMGIFFTVFYVMMAVLPGTAGLVRDLSGSVAAPALFAAALVLLCATGLLLFHAARRMPEQPEQ